MIQRGLATFGLDYGKCPRWLFERMVKLGREMTWAIVAEEGPEEFIRRLGDPAWFQSLGTVLAFDWNASGLTTILTAALKEAIRGEERDLGIFICGGKGKTSLKTPDEILNWGERLNFEEKNARALVYNSRMAAKVDSSLLQDGYQIYHHSFFFTRTGAWTVVQQGMNTISQSARRYHWHSKNIKDLIREPHSGIASQARGAKVLNLTALASETNRQTCLDLLKEGFDAILKDFQIMAKYATPLSQAVKISQGQQQFSFLNLENKEFRRHPVVAEDFSRNKYLQKILWRLCGECPESYEKFIAAPGVGPKTVRALALTAEVIYGAQPSYADPARYSFAHGGKDATPYPVDRETFDQTIETMKKFVARARLPFWEKQKIEERLKKSQSNRRLGLPF